MDGRCPYCLKQIVESGGCDCQENTPVIYGHTILASPIHEQPDKDTMLEVDWSIANTIGNVLPPVVDMDRIKKAICETMERVNAAARECALKSQYRHFMHPDRFEDERKTTFLLHNAQIIKADDLGGYIVNGHLVLLSEHIDYDEIRKIDVSRYQKMPEIKIEPFQSSAFMSFWWRSFGLGLTDETMSTINKET
jgi:hypothetical protein